MLINHKLEICKKLINIYEERFKAGSDFKKKISLPFNDSKNGYEIYVSEDSYKHKENIEQSVHELKISNIVNVTYDKFPKDIIEVTLNIENIEKVYELLERTSINKLYTDFFDELTKINSVTSNKLYAKLTGIHKKKLSIYNYIKNADAYLDAVKVFDALNNLKEDIMLRNFSVQLFKDSKRIEQIKTCLENTLNLVKNEDEDISLDDYFVSKGLFKNPTFTYIKGAGLLKINDQTIDLKKLGTVCAILSNSIKNTNFISIPNQAVTTIENLTTFHYHKADGLIVYLGGFSNHSKVGFLKQIAANISPCCFYHFGDIDFGGFSILSHLRRETNLNIKPLHMDISTLKENEGLTKKPNENNDAYICKLKKLLEDVNLADCKEVINYICENKIILEQETIGVKL
ncbi:MAG: DUF2220 domain-containing protein [Christensenellaceae bacterium]|jgi:hypothetical protein|nr:DUF2220 domain-containing protein [Christensenellaceae bacterium]